MSNVPMTSPYEDEVRCAIKRLQRNKAAGPGELPPALFKDGVGTLTAAITAVYWDLAFRRCISMPG